MPRVTTGSGESTWVRVRTAFGVRDVVTVEVLFVRSASATSTGAVMVAVLVTEPEVGVRDSVPSTW